MKKRCGLLLFASVVIGACTQEAAITPATSVDAPAATSTEPPLDTTVAPETTSLPDTTVPEAPSTVPETTTAPTTTLPATGTATNASTEYFIGGDPDGWLYLGRWTGNDWESDRDDDQVLREPAASSGDEVLVHEIDLAPLDGTIDGTAEACSDGRTGPVISPNARAPQDPGFGYRSIAFAANWSTAPRPAPLVVASVEEYVAAGAEAFGDLDVDTSSGTIEQLVVSDLDGDGDTESIVAYGGDGFSALLLIDADSGTSITIARSATSVSTPTTAAEGATPGESTTTPNDTFRTLAVVDLNGDGIAEIVGHAFAGTSAEVSVYSYDGTEVTPVLTAGC